METVSKTFPPLLWEQERFNSDRLPWPFPAINGERTEASRGLLGVRERRTMDDCSDVEDAPW